MGQHLQQYSLDSEIPWNAEDKIQNLFIPSDYIVDELHVT